MMAEAFIVLFFGATSSMYAISALRKRHGDVDRWIFSAMGAYLFACGCIVAAFGRWNA